MRVAAAALTLIAVACMTVALVGMVTGRPGVWGGWAVRVAALVCFGAAVALASAGR